MAEISKRMTLVPFEIKYFAVANPRPEQPPVMMAFYPSSFILFLAFWGLSNEMLTNLNIINKYFNKLNCIQLVDQDSSNLI